ncbi:MAG: lactonase family protein [Verrucomicrobia bacterium]|nr:lactonase family protein [Verrucomicrobiota bacterium]
MRLRITFALMLASGLATAAAPTEFHVYFGTYSKAPSKGIYRARFNAATGALVPVELAAEMKDPSFLALHPNGRFLYAIEESSDPKRTPGRGVSAYAIDAKSGALTLLNTQSVGSPGPCHLTVDRNARCVLIANYGGGSVAAIALLPDGKLGALGSVLQHTGSSVNAARQKAPHAHGIYLSPDNRFALVPDLGLDRVLVYRLDAAKATLTAHDPAGAALPPGSGPRHLAFSPDGKFVYVINELLCTMAVFKWDAAKGTLTDVQNVSTLPADEPFRPAYSTAEVFAHPSGKFLYGSNRGHHSIAVFAIDRASGKLTQIQNQSTLGKTPRNFALDPTGTWLLAENQDSGNVAVFKIDAATGKLTPTGPLAEVAFPVSAVFVPRR